MPSQNECCSAVDAVCTLSILYIVVSIVSSVAEVRAQSVRYQYTHCFISQSCSL